MTAWIKAGRIEDIPKRGARRIVTDSGPIAVFRTGDDRIFALEDRCPHKQGPLSQGIVHDTGVACPLHGWVIDFEAAEARAPDVGCVRRYEVRLSSNAIEIHVPAAEIRAAE